MAVINKFNVLARDIANGVHDFDTDTFKVMLTNTAPDALDEVKADITEISGGGSTGYTVGGHTMTITAQQNGPTTKLLAATVSITAGSAGFGPFRYAVCYNDTPTSPADPLVAWWDFGQSVSAVNTEVMEFRFDSENGFILIGQDA